MEGYGYGEFEGLKQIAELELSNSAWEFDLLGVWLDNKGRYYLGTDAGCSCPIPWDNYSREALTGPLTAEQAREEATSLIESSRPQEADSWQLGVDEWEAKSLLAQII